MLHELTPWVKPENEESENDLIKKGLDKVFGIAALIMRQQEEQPTQSDQKEKELLSNRISSLASDTVEKAITTPMRRKTQQNLNS